MVNIMERKKIKSSRYLAALLFTILIFLVGFIIGNYISDLKLQKVYSLEEDIKINYLGNELLFQMISDDVCSHLNTSSYLEEVIETGRKLTHMESIYGFDSPSVISLKNHYSLQLIRLNLIQKKAIHFCNYTHPQVMYFYTNYKGCADCEDQGLVLSNVNKEYPVFDIYSFEYQLDNPALNYLKKKHNIEKWELPVIIINEEKYVGFQSKDYLIEKMNLEKKLEEDKIKNPHLYDN
jgi:hypothetical protein